MINHPDIDNDDGPPPGHGRKQLDEAISIEEQRSQAGRLPDVEQSANMGGGINLAHAKLST